MCLSIVIKNFDFVLDLLQLVKRNTAYSKYSDGARNITPLKLASTSDYYSLEVSPISDVLSYVDGSRKHSIDDVIKHRRHADSRNESASSGIASNSYFAETASDSSIENLSIPTKCIDPEPKYKSIWQKFRQQSRPVRNSEGRLVLHDPSLLDTLILESPLFEQRDMQCTSTPIPECIDVTDASPQMLDSPTDRPSCAGLPMDEYQTMATPAENSAKKFNRSALNATQQSFHLKEPTESDSEFQNRGSAAAANSEPADSVLAAAAATSEFADGILAGSQQPNRGDKLHTAVSQALNVSDQHQDKTTGFSTHGFTHQQYKTSTSSHLETDKLTNGQQNNKENTFQTTDTQTFVPHSHSTTSSPSTQGVIIWKGKEIQHSGTPRYGRKYIVGQNINHRRAKQANSQTAEFSPRLNIYSDEQTPAEKVPMKSTLGHSSVNSLPMIDDQTSISDLSSLVREYQEEHPSCVTSQPNTDATKISILPTISKSQRLRNRLRNSFRRLKKLVSIT